ncbi:MAG: Kelch repeat-containing protein [Streptosporangiaceae bacterium]
MSDERQLRSLLTLAAEPPDSVQAPVPDLLERARRRRTRRKREIAAGAAAGAAAVVLLAAGLPSLIGTLSSARPSATAPSGLFPSGQRRSPSGPTFAQIARYRWSTLPPSPLGPRTSPLLTWAGSELIEIGGPGPRGTSPLAAAAYTPATGRWHAIAPLPSRLGTTLWARNAPPPVTVWTGSELFLTDGSWGAPPAPGVQGGHPLVGAPVLVYDPATNSWTHTSLPVQMYLATPLAAAWTGRDIVIAGAYSGHVHVGFYDPATGRWITADPSLPARHPARFVSLVAAGNRLLLWSWWDRTHAYHQGKTITSQTITSGVDVLALGTSGRWQVVTGNWPQHQAPIAPLTYTGSQILISASQIWCGLACSPPAASIPGYFADPVTLHRTPIPAGPLGQTEPTYIWTGRAVIAFGGATISGPKGLTMRPGALAIFDPVTSRWQRLPAVPGYPYPAGGAPLWTGTQLLYLTQNGRLLTFRG